ncbi:MAG: HD domain-containing phosphohydrolase [Planctomycetota bacterium]
MKKLYVDIPIMTLLPNTELPFHIYTRIGGEPTLFTGPGGFLNREHHTLLMQQGHSRVFVPEPEQELYYSYLEEHISRLLGEPVANPREQLRRQYQTGVMVCRRVLSHPESSSSERMAQEVVDSSVDMVVQSREVLANFSRILTISPDLYAHSMHVCFYGLALARATGLDSRTELADLGIGLLLHDLGKLKLPAELLEKPTPLTEKEWKQARRHPELGLEMVKGVAWVGDIARDVIRNHHRHTDGSGYPEDDSEFSKHARIAAIVNCFDSRSCHRPYRQAEPPFEVLKNMIRDGKGCYDTALLASLVRLLSR